MFAHTLILLRNKKQSGVEMNISWKCLLLSGWVHWFSIFIVVCFVYVYNMLVWFIFLVKSNTNRPYHHPDFRTLRPYLDPGFPDNYPYSQYINNEGELVFTPWRDSVDGHQRKKRDQQRKGDFCFWVVWRGRFCRIFYVSSWFFSQWQNISFCDWCFFHALVFWG